MSPFYKRFCVHFTLLSYVDAFLSPLIESTRVPSLLVPPFVKPVRNSFY